MYEFLTETTELRPIAAGIGKVTYEEGKIAPVACAPTAAPLSFIFWGFGGGDENGNI